MKTRTEKVETRKDGVAIEKSQDQIKDRITVRSIKVHESNSSVWGCCPMQTGQCKGLTPLRIQQHHGHDSRLIALRGKTLVCEAGQGGAEQERAGHHRKRGIHGNEGGIHIRVREEATTNTYLTSFPTMDMSGEHFLYLL